MSTHVIIPTKTRLDLLAPLVRQLEEQVDEIDSVVVVNNGDNPAMAGWLADHVAWHHWFHALDGRHFGIHQMWNMGYGSIPDEADDLDTYIFLNDDLHIEPDFVMNLRTALWSQVLWTGKDDLMAVSANYDHRRGHPGALVEYTSRICGGKYDGTGGFAGFAFAVKGEWFNTGYRFPVNMKWYCGDKDLVRSINAAGKKTAIALHAECVHFGHQTAGKWKSPEFLAQIEADRRVFRDKWGDQ